MIKVGVNYSFTPAASDPDLDPLTFSVTNKPAWANFSNQTGRLYGIAPTGTEGTYNDVVISVSDGKAKMALPAFSITVEPASSSNMPPVISGTPSKNATAGQDYYFRPDSSDPDGDTLTFSIQNKPVWASFNQSTGQMSGTPAQVDVGAYNNIVITVSDGTVSTSLPQFSIDVSAIGTGSATLSWTPPTQNTDGSALTDLAGYVIYYGLSATNMPNQIPLGNPGLATYVVDGLTPNTYSFAITAKNGAGIESDKSNVAVKTVN